MGCVYCMGILGGGRTKSAEHPSKPKLISSMAISIVAFFEAPGLSIGGVQEIRSSWNGRQHHDAFADHLLPMTFLFIAK